jgi:hypothetical protein
VGTSENILEEFKTAASVLLSIIVDILCLLDHASS